MSVQRSTRVAEVIKQEVADILLHRLKDNRVESARVSVTDVEMTRDLRHATVHVSILADPEQQSAALEGLKRASGFIRSELGKAVKLRATPEVHFKLDTSLEKGANVLALLNQLEKERQARESDDA